MLTDIPRYNPMQGKMILSFIVPKIENILEFNIISKKFKSAKPDI